MGYLSDPVIDELLNEETEDEEGHEVHIVCCVTDVNDISVQKAICGVDIDTDGPPDYSVDEDCRKCDILDEAHYCPLFGECQD